MLEMPSKLFLEPLGKIGRRSPLCPVIPLGLKGALAQYTFAEKEHKIKLNHKNKRENGHPEQSFDITIQLKTHICFLKKPIIIGIRATDENGCKKASIFVFWILAKFRLLVNNITLHQGP